ncbi:hypothetical protein GGH19_001006 [Coemansia sp. RSA 1807]|nr:hypothetical protein J3F82_004774 [Coemansia sp. RSA 637]KAJ2577811.1 hypothetical protein GGH19_001006 [Coemansia sp. RSA 1807]
MGDMLADLALGAGYDTATLDEVLRAWEVLVEFCESSGRSGNDTVSPEATLLDWSAEECLQTDAMKTEARNAASDCVQPIDSNAFWYGSAQNIEDEAYIVAATSSPASCINFGTISKYELEYMDTCLSPTDGYILTIDADNSIATSSPMTNEYVNVEILDMLAECEPNLIRTPNDMYTPRWIRGIGREKEGLCPVCFDNGTLNWRRMKCSAYW